MKNMITRSFQKLFFLVSIVVVISFSGGGTDAIGQFSNTTQKDAPTAIATTCSALLESCARQPSLCDDLLLGLYNGAVSDIMALNLESSADDIAVAKGIIKSALITSLSRQPALEDDLKEIEALCNEDIEGL